MRVEVDYTMQLNVISQNGYPTEIKKKLYKYRDGQCGDTDYVYELLTVYNVSRLSEQNGFSSLLLSSRQGHLLSFPQIPAIHSFRRRYVFHHRHATSIAGSRPLQHLFQLFVAICVYSDG